MRCSILIYARNNGASLAKTLGSCARSMDRKDGEIVVVDNASTDDCACQAKERHPDVRMIQFRERRTIAYAKHFAAQNSRGDTLVFIDCAAHPRGDAIQRLVRSAEDWRDAALITPQLQQLDCTAWRNLPAQDGHGYALDLRSLDVDWLPFRHLKKADQRNGDFHLSPALCGSCFAVSRRLYERAGGFDPEMAELEDADLGLRCWMMGCPVVHDPAATIGHHGNERPPRGVIAAASRLRMARKVFTESVWRDWVHRARGRVEASDSRQADQPPPPEGTWASAWMKFEAARETAEQQRAYLMASRQRDEFLYAKDTGQKWPRFDLEAESPSAMHAPLYFAQRQEAYAAEYGFGEGHAFPS